MKPAFNKQTQTQADEAKMQRSSNSRQSHLKIKYGHERRVGGSTQKKLNS